jgi:hypothetical protein
MAKKKKYPDPPVGSCLVYTIDPSYRITALLGDQRPNVEQGYGGWEEVTRPRRSPLTTWRGAPALHLSLPLLLDGFASNTSVEPQLGIVEKMGSAVLGSSGANADPPHVHLQARGNHVPYQELTWVINDIQWGDAEMDSRGNRTRQHFTLQLVQYVADVQVQDLSAANRRRAAAAAKTKKAGASTKRVVAKHGKPSTNPSSRSATRSVASATVYDGEDLVRIAARELGDASRWVEIAKLNGLRDPRAVTRGQVIRLP